MKNIRNFVIISHIDNGKSTLSDRILEICQAVPKDKMTAQFLDHLELEREKGITIKAKAVRLTYTLNATTYTLNLIDTPGHVDFAYEVSKTLKACEGAILLVDATSGIQAQTLANYYLAKSEQLTIISAVNKIDLTQAQPERVTNEIIETLGFLKNEIFRISAKTGEGIAALLEAVIGKIPSPKTDDNLPLKAFIFDSSFDPYKGVIVFVRIFDGKVVPGEDIKFLSNGKTTRVLELGYLTPDKKAVDQLLAGEVGFIATDLKEISLAQVGDTITLENQDTAPISGFHKAKPLVFFSFYPIDPNQHPNLKDTLEKIKLSDYALTINAESSTALGQGFRVGFLGLLHAEIIQETIERNYNISVIATSPQVPYIFEGKVISKPTELTYGQNQVLEPWVRVSIFAPQNYLGQILEFLYSKKASERKRKHIGSQVHLDFEMPLSEVMIDFYEALKSVSQGYASFDFEEIDARPATVVRLDILVNNVLVDALSQIVHSENAYQIGKKLVEKLKDVIPRQQIPIPIQAAQGGKIIARETITTYRKDVTAKLYGGDVTRKMKLIEKQKKGKKRMKRFGNVDIPQEAFLAVLKI